MTDYTPIACSRYDDFELAIMHREWLRLGLDANDADLHELVVCPWISGSPTARSG
jgi:transcriptional antiterminator Rof (Rho-off)